jgi:hypothetical protein
VSCFGHGFPSLFSLSLTLFSLPGDSCWKGVASVLYLFFLFKFFFVVLGWNLGPHAYYASPFPLSYVPAPSFPLVLGTSSLALDDPSVIISVHAPYDHLVSFLGDQCSCPPGLHGEWRTCGYQNLQLSNSLR